MLCLGLMLFAQTSKEEKESKTTPYQFNENRFKQLGQELPTPNVYRSASGAPGHLYWQQKVDYVMDITLDDATQRVYGTEEITYTNNSPDELSYLWIQLDQNMRAPDSDTYKVGTNAISDGMPSFEFFRMFNDFEGGFNIEYIKDGEGNDAVATYNKTMLRIDLPQPLKTGESTKLNIKWWYNINDRMEIGGRSGYEYFEKDENYLYTIAQFFPRMAVYSDVEGWQNKQFLGRGEFALPFGDYDVKITTAADLVVGGTGLIQNMEEVLTAEQIERYDSSKVAIQPVMIITEEEAIENEKSRSTETKTWHFKAENVRDFGFAASRKFIWDAQGVPFDDRTVMAMSLYPKEGNPLWEKYSTKAVVLTLEVYSRHTFDYPYPVAYSVHADRIGMEYPMICFNFGRPDEDGEYSDRTKYGMIGVIIHEVGHNYFPMIVNSDERQWTWMDEGLNTFLQYMTEKEWEDETEKPFPSRRGPADKIVRYMKGDKSNISPIMSNSESIWQFGNNAYGKPATALSILRETVMEPELFDYAFKTYANRWMFKHPSPADFFRTMEDASAVDLDWFWRGWFYSNNHVDIDLEDVKEYQLKFDPPAEEEASIRDAFENDAAENEKSASNKKKKKKRKKKKGKKNKAPQMEDLMEQLKSATTFDPIKQVSLWNEKPAEAYKESMEKLSDRKKTLLNEDGYYYELTLHNKGGLPMPVILEFVYEDESTEIMKLPAELWKLEDSVSKVFITDKKVTQVILDPKKETADVDKSNNYWPKDIVPEQFQKPKE